MGVTISDWKAAYVTALEARVGMSGVTVYDADQTLPDTDRESVIVGNWTTNYEHLTFGTIEETYTVEGMIRIVKPNDAVTARNRAIAIVAEVKAAVEADWDLSGVVFDSMFLGYEASENIWPENGRVCTIEFTIGVEAHA